MNIIEQYGVTGGNAVLEKREDFTFDNAGLPATAARYSAIAAGSGSECPTSAYVFNAANRLTTLTHTTTSGTTINSHQYTYDIGGRASAYTNTHITAAYTYDLSNQVTAADYNQTLTDESYSYDSNGNRTNTGYATGAFNRLTSNGTYAYTYDDEGNLTGMTKSTTGSTYNFAYSTVYAYDYRNRLTSVANTTVRTRNSTGVQTTSYSTLGYYYDGLDRLIGKVYNLSGTSICIAVKK